MNEAADRGKTEVNRLALVAVVTIATIIGTAPYVLTTRRPLLSLVFAACALLVSTFQARALTTSASYPPTPLEFIVGGIGAILLPTMAGLYGIVSYWLVYGLSGVVAVIARWIGSGLQLNALAISFWASVPIATASTLGLTENALRTLGRQLYPRAAGLHSAVYALAAFRRGRAYARIGVVLAVAGIAAALILVRPQDEWWFRLTLALLTAISLFFASVGIYVLPVGSEAAKGDQGAVDLIKALFEAGGYSVVPSPRTGREDIDPLLARTPDLYVEGPHRAFAVEVREHEPRTEEEQEGWTALSDLSSAAWGLHVFQKDEHPDGPPAVEPLLVLIERDAPDPALVYLRKGLLRILRVENKGRLAEELRTITEPSERRALAERYLREIEVDSNAAAGV